MKRSSKSSARATAKSSRAPSQRQLRAGELIRHALSEILQREDLRAPALARTSVTVTEVRTSPDLKSATVFCAPLGASLRAEHGEDFAAIDALNGVAPLIRTLLARRVELKFAPELAFRLDETFGAARRVDDLLSSEPVRRDLASPSGDGPSGE